MVIHLMSIHTYLNREKLYIFGCCFHYDVQMLPQSKPTFSSVLLFTYFGFEFDSVFQLYQNINKGKEMRKATKTLNSTEALQLNVSFG